MHIESVSKKCLGCKEPLEGYRYWHPECVIEMKRFNNSIRIDAYLKDQKRTDLIPYCYNAFYCNEQCFKKYHSQYIHLIGDEHQIRFIAKGNLIQKMRLWNKNILYCNQCHRMILNARDEFVFADPLQYYYYKITTTGEI